MLKNLLALHVAKESNQETISIEDIYDITESLLLPASKQNQRAKVPVNKVVTSYADFEWPPQEEEFVITLDEMEWNLGTVRGYLEEANKINVQLVETLRTRAKDDCGKVYWAYSEENCNSYRTECVLDMRPSISLAKNIKRKEPVFALLNREMIESITAPLYPARLGPVSPNI